jgi:isoleucyl-tRNA synthetase
LNFFCGTTMSAFYLDILKDRLYTSGTGSHPRRSAQTVLYRILDGMLRLMSPILCFTAAEAWDFLHGIAENGPIDERSIYFTEFPPETNIEHDPQMMDKWAKLIKIRSEITKALELARQDKVIGHPLEAEVLLKADAELTAFLNSEWNTIKEISIISEMSALQEDTPEVGIRFASEEIPGFVVQVQPASGEKCLRCWTRSTTVGENQAHPEICGRCSTVLAELNSAG